MALHEAYLVEIWVTFVCYLGLLLISLDRWRRGIERLTVVLFCAALTGVAGRGARLFGGSIIGHDDLDLVEVFVWIDIVLWPVALVFTTLYGLNIAIPREHGARKAKDRN